MFWLLNLVGLDIVLYGLNTALRAKLVNYIPLNLTKVSIAIALYI